MAANAFPLTLFIRQIEGVGNDFRLGDIIERHTLQFSLFSIRVGTHKEAEENKEKRTKSSRYSHMIFSKIITKTAKGKKVLTRQLKTSFRACVERKPSKK